MNHFLLDVNQMNGRIMTVKLKSKGRNLNFVSCYAPHSGYSTEDKLAFWDKLATLAARIKEVLYIGGDMDALLHNRFQAEENVMGPNISGRGLNYLRTVSDATLQNRSLFIQFCEQANMNIIEYIMNTFFDVAAKM